MVASTGSTEETTTDLFSYLESLPRSSLLALYEDEKRGEYAAKTILQKLPELARQFTMRLTVCGGAFPFKMTTAWSASRNKKDVKFALTRMEALCVINPIKLKQTDELNNEVTPKSGKRARHAFDNIDPNAIVVLTEPFYRAIQLSLTSLKRAPYPELSNQDLENLTEYEKQKPTEKKRYPNEAPTPTELETFTQMRWDSTLHHLVGTGDRNYEDPPEAIKEFLKQTGLMQPDPDYKGKFTPPLIISSKGYEFMLNDVHVQVWLFILKYIQTQIESEEAKREALLFIICLSFCKVGKGYRAADLSKGTKNVMKDLNKFGLLYICKIGGCTIFFPTRVAVNLVVGGLADGADAAGSASENTSVAALSSSAAATRVLENALEESTPSKNHIAIIVQTNFQVCAYTTSTLHFSMLGLFCDVTSFRRLPNVIFYRITRDSVKAAFKLGIQARQILRFLKMHAHPRLRTGDQPLIPGNVEDQIILWDRERSRVKTVEVYSLLCHDPDEYEAVRQYAEDIEAFGWGNETKRRILVNYDKAEKVQNFVRRWRAKRAGM